MSDGDFSILFYPNHEDLSMVLRVLHLHLCLYSYESNKKYCINTVVDPGEGPGPPPPLFFNQTEA